MEESQAKAEEDASEKKTFISRIYHPCHFLQEALKSFLRCLGFDYESKDEKSSPQKTSSDEDQVVENSSFNRNSSQETSTTTEQAADPPSTAADVQENTSTTQLSSVIFSLSLSLSYPSL